MRCLYILYDDSCGLCLQLKQWLEYRPSYYPLELIPNLSEEAVHRFPEVVTDELAVISDDGEVWLGDAAFLMVLWALPAYRSWALRLSTPALRPFAKQAFAALSSGRYAISQIFGLYSERELAERLATITLPGCALPEGNAQ